jgi:UDP-N-acetylmuramoyl-L-alanyl-D-glutamate--2,6-diaminopimelate ligase
MATMDESYNEWVRLSSLAADLKPQIHADSRRSRLNSDPDITLVTEDSRRVTPGALFVAVAGSIDGHDFIGDAIRRGAAAIVAERADGVPPDVPALVVPSSRQALALLAARMHGGPARDLTLVGFTGTFGKTSTSEILRVLLDAGGFEPAVVGSLGARYGGFSERGAGLTTPAAPELHAWLARLRGEGARQIIIEVTSHALRLDRVHGLRFGGGIIAAIMPGEHTDFHRTYEDYVDAKRLFLQYLARDALLVYDADNRAARMLAREAQVDRIAGLSLGGRSEGPDDVVVGDVTLDADGALFTVRGERLRSSLLGRAHVRNVGLALTYALAAGVPLSTARDVVASLSPLRRRMERYEADGRVVLDDTAGHPDSLEAAFEAAAVLPHARLWVAYAIRGNRGADINRRNATMLARLTALHGAGMVVLTASADVVGPHDRATAEEIDAARETFLERGGRPVWHDTLADAMREIAAKSSPDDLILLLGAQGMNEGKRLLMGEPRIS